ncbi:hypothetical protein BOTBODRAFT_37505 [Botryobasidium botryosum FD-172 SS1]|uniref:MYND-type domain-containing protein n=1 Tax=Botryobasidium botryosum (strain FD-172 SS1) TaxID=930990 RepID=A0A067LZT4_BOTB1|nr:hypothetical protein BOTBODRAFT_37505 [Botryobasidium botryosum FD-172 SS1]
MSESKSTLAPNGLRSFTVKHAKAKDPDQEYRCTLGVQLSGGQAQYMLILATLPKDDPYATPASSRLSSIITSHPVESPDAQGHYKFYMKTYSENEGVLEYLLDAGIIERDLTASPVAQGYVTFPLVRVKIPIGEMAKVCNGCERWELCSDERRMRGCSGCKPSGKAWYCSVECQKRAWRVGYPAHKEVCGK